MVERLLTWACVAAALGSIGWAIKLHSDRIATVTEVDAIFGGAPGADLVRRPARVVAYRLATPADYGQRDVDIADYQVAGAGVDVPAAAAGELARALVDAHSYEMGMTVSCLPLYGVRLVFLRSDDEIEANFCFGCSQLLVRRSGKVVGGAYFEPGAAEFARLIRPLFPDDPAIQRLGRPAVDAG